MHPPALRRGVLTAVSTGLLLLAAAAPAAAHVGVEPATAPPGGETSLAFQVPDERPDVSTVKVEVVMPEDHPLASVSVRPVPGWTVQIQKKALPKPVKTDDGEVTTAVSTITWSGGRIQPGQFQEFQITAGPLPDHAGRLLFKTLQTYDDGSVDRWIDPPVPGGAEPEHPAPVVGLVPAGRTDATAPAHSPAPSAARTESTAAGTPATDVTARLLGEAGLAVGFLGLLFGITARIRAARAARRSDS